MLRHSPPLLPGGVTTRLEGVRLFLLKRLPGRLLLVGLVIKLLAGLTRLVAGSLPPLLGALDTIGSLALAAGLGYLVYRLVVRAKRRLLWRVRRKLILSYIFIGVVPALLIVAFFVISGLLLFLNVGSFLVRNSFRNLTDEAQFLADTAAVELQRAATGDSTAVLDRREANLGARYPGASIALVPVGAEPCSGRGPSAPSSAASPVQPGGAAQPREPARPTSGVQARAVGPWLHARPPDVLPEWVSCSGFAGIIHAVGPVSALAGEEDEGRLVVRAVGLPKAPRPPFAVVVDIPVTDFLEERLREETGITLGDMTVVGEGSIRTIGRAPHATAARVGAISTAATQPSGRGNWVALLEDTDWQTGRTGSIAIQIAFNIGEMYQRLLASQTRIGTISFSRVLLGVLLLIAVLFLIIEAAALLMGLVLAKSITGSVHELFTGTERVRQGDFSHKIAVRARDQLGELASSFNTMTDSIIDLLREAEEKKRLEEELRIAREIQMSLLPRGRLSVPGLAITALCVPAREVGGDYYDLLPLGEERLGVLIADVSGKGTSAALYMAELKGLILSLSQIYRSPRELLIKANRIIADNLDNRSFITVTYAVIDLRARTMTYARAGHTPLMYRCERVAGRPEVRVLVPDGLVLGLRIDDGQMFERLLEEAHLPLASGDLLMFYTDGITEAMNGESDCFGEARLCQLLSEHGDLPGEELRERILREIEAFVAGAPQHDDMTMILVKVEDVEVGAVGTQTAPAPA
jgi:sigma-B regulation protein RsbU (phosphoserine phosphatase)